MTTDGAPAATETFGRAAEPSPGRYRRGMKATALLWTKRIWLYWPAFAAGVSAAMLAAAHLFEAAGYTPCALCLTQREVYWTALAIAAASALLWMRSPEARLSRAVDALLGAAFLTGALVAFYHAGVEWKFWPGPPSCTGRGVAPVSAEDIANALLTGGRVVMCDEAAWRDPILRISMAGWNGLISLALGAASVLAASRATETMTASLDD